MTQLEQKQAELIELLESQIMDLTMMSKIELGDDVIDEIKKLQAEIEQLKTQNV
tara:strand:- start:164 stop:325 length:162 start_codon:yes stop_codon:yes gene_type:complete